MKRAVQNWLETVWYQDQPPPLWLKIVSLAFKQVAYFRRLLYQKGLLKQVKLPVPVIIVGNLTVGGTGKSPLVVYLAHTLSQAGYRPGIISRGYGGQSARVPQRAYPGSCPEQVGDEAVMLAAAVGCPVAVCSKRSKAAELLLAETDCNLLIADDGLQHYALQRDLELVVIDGERRFGNGYCLPAGPLREDVSRLQTVDMLIVNGAPINAPEFAMQVQAAYAVNLQTNEKKPLQAFRSEPVYAVAGIGNPQRFFKLLAQFGIQCISKAFPDHYHYQAGDLQFDEGLPIMMTEKDAVKCQRFVTEKHWCVPIAVELSPGFNACLLQLLQDKANK